jgi:hypothetical protein
MSWTTAGDMSVYTVVDNDTTANSRIWDTSGGGTGAQVFSLFMGNYVGMNIYGTSIIQVTATGTSGYRLGSYNKDGTNANVYVNGSSIANSTSAPDHTTSSSAPSVGMRQNSSLHLNGRIQEIIHFPAAQTSTNHAAIETDINGYFSIYT